MRLRWPLALLCILAGCSRSGLLRDGVYANDDVRYRVGTLGPEWRRLDVGQVSFVHERTHATISANAVCRRTDARLRTLTAHLLIGLRERRVLSRRRFPFDGREALRTVVRGTLDGVPVQLDIVVLKKDWCVFDLVHTASPDRFGETRADFERFVAGFRKLASDGARR